jgi:hypothetical protein
MRFLLLNKIKKKKNAQHISLSLVEMKTHGRLLMILVKRARKSYKTCHSIC